MGTDSRRSLGDLGRVRVGSTFNSKTQRRRKFRRSYTSDSGKSFPEKSLGEKVKIESFYLVSSYFYLILSHLFFQGLFASDKTLQRPSHHHRKSFGANPEPGSRNLLRGEGKCQRKLLQNLIPLGTIFLNPWHWAKEYWERLSSCIELCHNFERGLEVRFKVRFKFEVGK